MFATFPLLKALNFIGIIFRGLYFLKRKFISRCFLYSYLTTPPSLCSVKPFTSDDNPEIFSGIKEFPPERTRKITRLLNNRPVFHLFQRELFSSKLEGESGRERKMSSASTGSMKNKWLKAFKSLKTPPPETEKWVDVVWVVRFALLIRSVRAMELKRFLQFTASYCNFLRPDVAVEPLNMSVWTATRSGRWKVRREAPLPGLASLRRFRQFDVFSNNHSSLLLTLYNWCGCCFRIQKKPNVPCSVYDYSDEVKTRCNLVHSVTAPRSIPKVGRIKAVGSKSAPLIRRKPLEK